MEELHQLIIWELEMALIFNFLDATSSRLWLPTPRPVGAVARLASSLFLFVVSAVGFY